MSSWDFINTTKKPNKTNTQETVLMQSLLKVGKFPGFSLSFFFKARKDGLKKKTYKINAEWIGLSSYRTCAVKILLCLANTIKQKSMNSIFFSISYRRKKRNQIWPSDFDDNGKSPTLYNEL